MSRAIFSALITGLILATSQAHAEVIPPKGDDDQRVRVVEYNPNDVVRLTGYIGYQTHIELAPGEKFVNLFAGDTAGIDFGTAGNNLFLKPKAELVRTNLTIVTNKRLYQFDYRVSKATRSLSNRSDMIYSLRFIYPHEEAMAAAAELERQNAERKFQQSLEDRPRNYDYWFCGDESLKPLKAYDNGVQTHIIFPSRAELPAMYIKNDDGSESLVNFHIDAGELVIHREGKRFVLRRGQLVGCIVNKDYSGGGERLSNNVIAPGVERITKGDIE